MKIVIDARLYGLENAGLGRYTINLINQLAILDKENEYVVLLRKEYFKTINLPSNFKKVLADFRHYTFSEQIRLPRIISKEKPDLVHFLHMNVPLFYRGRFVVTVHDLLMQKHRGAQATTLPFYSYFSKLIAAKYVFKNAVLKSKKIIVPSNAVKEEVVSFYKVNPKKIDVTYEGITDLSKKTESFQKLSQKYGIKGPYIIYSGNAYPHKNLDRVVRSIKLLNERGININFYLTSARTVFTKKLERLISKEKTDKHVKLLGFVPDSDLGEIFHNSVAFIYPSLSEGFGLPGLEALSSNTLLLCSNIPVFKEIYKDIPIYFDPFSVDSISESISKALTLKTEERKKILTKADTLIKTFSWKKMALETLEIYRQALKA